LLKLLVLLVGLMIGCGVAAGVTLSLAPAHADNDQGYDRAQTWREATQPPGTTATAYIGVVRFRSPILFGAVSELY
jgi:MFS superfamily sulfate permease-like transporter